MTIQEKIRQILDSTDYSAFQRGIADGKNASLARGTIS